MQRTELQHCAADCATVLCTGFEQTVPCLHQMHLRLDSEQCFDANVVMFLALAAQALQMHYSAEPNPGGPGLELVAWTASLNAVHTARSVLMFPSHHWIRH